MNLDKTSDKIEQLHLPFKTICGGSGAMFDGIAHRYDLLNKMLSFGLDRRWRKRLILALNLPQDMPIKVLDVATGTADVALAVAKCHPYAHVVGVDPSAKMLEMGRQKTGKKNLHNQVVLEEGNAQALNYDSNFFTAACISFGIRNVPSRAQGLAEMVRVTQPGGRVAVLELSEPRKGWLASCARAYIRHGVPRIGAWLSGNKEYRYLQESIEAFPAPEDFAKMMRAAGLCNVQWERQSWGVANLYWGEVPAAESAKSADGQTQSQDNIGSTDHGG